MVGVTGKLQSPRYSFPKSARFTASPKVRSGWQARLGAGFEAVCLAGNCRCTARPRVLHLPRGLQFDGHISKLVNGRCKPCVTLSHLGHLLSVSVLLCSIRFRARRRSSARKGVCRAARSNLSSPRPTRVSTLASMGPVQPESVSAPPRPPLRHLSANKVCSVHTEDNTDVVVDLGRCHGRKSAPRSFQGW